MDRKGRRVADGARLGGAPPEDWHGPVIENGGGVAGGVMGGEGGACGGEGGKGGVGGSCGGRKGGDGQRLPQSVQSVPRAHTLYDAPVPPSSQSPSEG
eukprot:1997500-Prymnesium_polylepis.1